MGKNRITLLGAGILAGVLMAGCAHKDPLVGTWAGMTPSPLGGTANTTLVFTEDGKDTISSQVSGSTGNNQINGSGTYTVSGDTITQNFTSLSFNGHPCRRAGGQLLSRVSSN